MASEFKVNVSMTGDTVTALQENGYSLYGFRVVQASGSARPVAWFKSDFFELTNTIDWTEEYAAYTSRSKVIARGHIDTAASYPIDLGEVLEVTNPMGIGEVTHEGGTERAICILNKTETRLTCGISQATPDGLMNPICAFTLLGNNLDEIVPIEKIFLMFSSKPLNTGVVVEQSYGPGLLIDLTGVDTRSVSFDADKAWTWEDNAGWATEYPPNQNMVPLCIESPR